MIDAVARAQHRGGFRQRKRARELAGQPQEHSQASNIGSLLMVLWAWNQLSGSTLQAIANAAKQYGLTHPEIQAMARIGTSGKYPNHCNRDLMKVYKLDDITLPPYIKVQVPCCDPKSDPRAIVNVDTSIQAPHDVFSHLAHNFPQEFKDRIGNTERIKK